MDIDRFKNILGESVNTDGERYGLSWAGKSEAYKVIQTPTKATLQPKPEESIDWDNAENVFIEGENLEVLKALQKSYYGKIKMIYIDPPYNTGNNSFIYPDKFSETKEEYLKRIGEKSEDGSLIKQEEGEQKKLYFVAETKGTSSLQELEQSKPLEAMKIKCGIKHFALFEDLRFRQVKNLLIYKKNEKNR